MNKWNCDICGERTYLVPETEPVTEEVEVLEGGKKVKREVPSFSTMKKQNPHTGEMYEVQVPKVKDKQKRCNIVKLQMGLSESVQRDFCTECLKEHILPKAKEFWDVLEGVSPK